MNGDLLRSYWSYSKTFQCKQLMLPIRRRSRRARVDSQPCSPLLGSSQVHSALQEATLHVSITYAYQLTYNSLRYSCRFMNDNCLYLRLQSVHWKFSRIMHSWLETASSVAMTSSDTRLGDRLSTMPTENPCRQCPDSVRPEQ